MIDISERQDILMHYASPYYDPVKAHEYYEQHKQLKGRPTGRLTDEGAWKAILDTRASNRVIFEEFYDLPTESQKNFGGQISTHVSEYFIKAIMGTVNIDSTWNDYVKEWNTLGGSDCEKEVNEWYAAQQK